MAEAAQGAGNRYDHDHHAHLSSLKTLGNLTQASKLWGLAFSSLLLILLLPLTKAATNACSNLTTDAQPML